MRSTGITTYTKQEQLKDNREKKTPMFGKKKYPWNNKGFQKPKPKKNDIIDDHYSAWLATQPCVITGLTAKRGKGANDMHCHHIDGRMLGRNDYRQVPLIGWAHAWGDKAYHANTKYDFIQKHAVPTDDIKEFFNEHADRLYKEYFKYLD